MTDFLVNGYVAIGVVCFFASAFIGFRSNDVGNFLASVVIGIALIVGWLPLAAFGLMCAPFVFWIEYRNSQRMKAAVRKSINEFGTDRAYSIFL